MEPPGDVWSAHPEVSPLVVGLTWPTVVVEFRRLSGTVDVEVESWCSACNAPCCSLTMTVAWDVMTTNLRCSADTIACSIAYHINKAPCCCGLLYQAANRAAN